MSELPKTFDPAEIEARWYAHWEANGLFRPERPGAEPWTIVNPPPNVTGSLHIGHALDNTLQDVLTRYERLRGKDALWVVGMDHAGIATQMVVERQLEERQDKRTNYSREEFVAKVWDWKAESGGAIMGQLKRLGCSMDWANERFTMDEGFSKAVLKVFVDLYNQGLIYRDKRLVNWDPGLGTAISDLEVETREVKGSFWQIAYPLADSSGSITVATTRPETMLADMAVAVHPEDERYKAMIGKQVRLPITGRPIPIIADEHADPELGSGAVKITPGHDFNDFEVGKRAGFKAGEMLNMLDAKARVVQTSDGLIPDDLLGLSVAEARKAVVERLKADGVLVPHVDKEGAEHDAEPRTIQTPFGDRSNAVIEPWLTDQWYVDAETLAKGPIEAVQSGAIKIVPKTWEKTFFNWMENIQPWCVSRQLWWGHRIPAWFGPPIGQDEESLKDGTFAWLDEIPDLDDPRKRVRATPEVFVAETFEEALKLAENRYSNIGIDFSLENGFKLTEVNSFSEARESFYGAELGLWQDPDVLDTWFSSALWPFATMGWPDETHPKLHGRYPNDVLISGFDILFFWDARMMMQGMHFMGQGGQRPLEESVPFRTLYLHGLVRAPDGAKMSKSKGNVVDPLGLIDKYGADALRFFMAAMESQGRDIKMDEKRVEGYRNFATKLWNAARFCQANGISASTSIVAPAATLAVNRWIIGEVVETLAALDKAMTELRFDAAASTIYHFVWDRFCDWYLELIKPELEIDEQSNLSAAEQEARAEETKVTCGWALDQILVMLHPFMPFVTEELWSKLGDRENYPIITARWPEPGAIVDLEAKRQTEWVIELIKYVRAARSDLNIPPSAKLDWFITRLSEECIDPYFNLQQAIRKLARVDRTYVSRNVQGLDGGRTGLSRLYVWFEEKDRARQSTMQIIAEGFLAFAVVEGVIDIDTEKARLAKALEASAKEAKSLESRLANPAFVERAKPEAIEKARADHAHHAGEVERLTAALARLG